MKGYALTLNCLVALGVLGVLACGAQGAFLTANFDDGNNPFTTVAGAPAVSTTYAHSGTYSLYLASGSNATLAIPVPEGGGTVTLWIYDLGKWSTANATGWRVGLTNTAMTDTAMVALTHRSWTPTSDGYQCGNVAEDGSTAFGGWFSPQWASTSRQVVSLSPTAGDGSEGSGMWSQWSFRFSPDGNVVMNLCDANGVPIPSNSTMTQVVPGANTLFIMGGGGVLGGLYVDDIVINTIPEPVTMAVLGVGGLLAVLRRKRRR